MEAAFGVGVFVFREEPEADGYLRSIEGLAGEGDHTVLPVGLDEGATDVAVAGPVEDQAPIAEVLPAGIEDGHDFWCEVSAEALNHDGAGIAVGSTQN